MNEQHKHKHAAHMHEVSWRVRVCAREAPSVEFVAFGKMIDVIVWLLDVELLETIMCCTSKPAFEQCSNLELEPSWGKTRTNDQLKGNEKQETHNTKDTNRKELNNQNK